MGNLNPNFPRGGQTGSGPLPGRRPIGGDQPVASPIGEQPIPGQPGGPSAGTPVSDGAAGPVPIPAAPGAPGGWGDDNWNGTGSSGGFQTSGPGMPSAPGVGPAQGPGIPRRPVGPTPKMPGGSVTDATNANRAVSAPRIPPMGGGTPEWYGKNAPQGNNQFTPPPSTGLRPRRKVGQY